MHELAIPERELLACCASPPRSAQATRTRTPGEVFHAADRPYGLIEGTVLRDDAPPAGPARN